ncbi:MAG: DUF6036 family nucleotidyltransferase, partial [Acidobacteriota bacterium]
MLRGEIEQVLTALNQAEVLYLVVGGLAVVLHGHLRTTMDLDLVVRLQEENLGRALDALQDLGYASVLPVPLSQLADPAIRDMWIREKNMIAFSLWNPGQPLFKLDILVSEPFDFASTYQRSVQVTLGATKARVVSLDDLIDLKRQSGRPQDLADIDALETIR